MTCFRLLFLISFAFISAGSNSGSGTDESYKRLYKRLQMKFMNWKKFIHMTTSYYIDTTIECGGVCNSQFEQCDMFVYHKDIQRCHVGRFELDSGYLNGYGDGGTYPVHLSMDKLKNDLEDTYFKLTYVQEESYWHQLIYHTETLNSPADHYDCSFICRNVERNRPCDLFVFEAGECYLGISTHRGQGIGTTLENMTVYATKDSMNTIKDDSEFAYKSDVISSHWTAHLKQSHEDSISIQVQCEAMAVLEYWHYSVFNPDKNICYFGFISMDSFMSMAIAGSEPEPSGEPAPPAAASSEPTPAASSTPAPLIVDDQESRQIQINTAELGFFPVDFFTDRSSVIYQPFTYTAYPHPLNKEHCSIQCAFDSDFKCDFWYIHHDHCYLGSFNHEGGYPVINSHETITAKIFKDFVNDMMDQLYFTSVDVQNNRWSSRIREKFETVSDYECGGHAALADNNIDYWIWIDGNCFLGDLNYASAVDYDDDVRNDINIYRGNSWTNLNDYYNEKFTLSDYIWTKYIFDTYPLEDSQDTTECGVRCEFSGDHCDFFTIDNSECHLGRYNFWDSGEVESTAAPMTYHKHGQIQWVKNNNFYWWSSGYYWYKWTYKIEHRPTIWKCFFECYHDDKCDFFVDVHNYCCYGDFQHTGNPATTWSNQVTLYIKKGRGPDASFITTNFNDAYGGGSKPNSVLRWWPYGIWAHYSDVESSEQCAFRCYIRAIDNCAFYYWGSGYCHLGHFNGAWHRLVGGYDENTKYHIRKDFNFASWTRHHSHGHTNDGACRNYGYKELTFNGNSFRLTSGNNKWGHHYGSNERCYWGVYAPGAQKLRFELLNNFKGNLDTYDGSDYLSVYLGVGRGGYRILHFHTYHAKHCCWEYEAEIMSVFWHSNHELGDWGFRARITRIG